MQIFNQLPITLYRLQNGLTPKLRQLSKQLQKNSYSFDYVAGKDGLYHPFISQTFQVPNGLSLRPMGLNLAEIFSHFNSKVIVYEIQKGKVLPNNFILLLQRDDHYSLQTANPIKASKFCKQAEIFFKQCKRLTKQEFMQKLKQQLK